MTLCSSVVQYKHTGLNQDSTVSSAPCEHSDAIIFKSDNPLKNNIARTAC